MIKTENYRHSEIFPIRKNISLKSDIEIYTISFDDVSGDKLWMSDGASADLEVSHTPSGAKLYNCMSLQSIKGKQETLLYYMSC